MKCWVKLGKKLNAHPVPLSLTPPGVCRGKIGRTVARMVMCQDRQGNKIFTIGKRRNLRKNNSLWTKMNIKLLIFVVGNKCQTIKEYISFFSFPGSTSLLCLRLLTPNAAGRWSSRRLQLAHRGLFFCCFLLFLSISPLWPLKWDAGNLCSDTWCISCSWKNLCPAQANPDLFLQPPTSNTGACQPNAHEYCLFLVPLKDRS